MAVGAVEQEALMVSSLSGENTNVDGLCLGFQYEGIFKNHMIIRGRSRDTWWASIIQEDWEVVKKAFEQWLLESNFDQDGRQKRKIEDLRANAMQPKDI